MPRIILPIEERFYNNIFYCFSGCWLWTLKLDRDGYGHFSENHKVYKAHRWSYERFIGKIPKGLTIDHKCRIRNCVNPNHLQPKTFGENVLLGNGWAGVNSRKTHCSKGHEFNEENTIRNDKGHRTCKTCQPNLGTIHRNKNKKLCSKGHEFTIESEGRRRCVPCRRNNARKRYKKK